jgi:hypothetical protein
MKKTVTNTAVQTKNDPMGVIASSMVMGAGAAIEHQEAQGQRELVESETLPSECSEEGQKVLEAAGVVFGKHVGGDTVFRYVTLPAGWKKVPTDHVMWSMLVDEKGRERASIFYKGAFYDRKAAMRAVRRFRIQEDFKRNADGSIVHNYETTRAYVLDGDTRLFETDWITIPQPADGLPAHEHRAAWDAYQNRMKTEGACAVAGAWLAARYPNHADGAYWDDEAPAKTG